MAEGKLPDGQQPSELPPGQVTLALSGFPLVPWESIAFTSEWGRFRG